MNRRGADRTGPLGGAGMVALWGAPSLISSLQYSSINVGGANATTTVTITAVDTSRSLLIRGNQYSPFGAGNEVRVALGELELTNSTTVTAHTGGNPSGTDVNMQFAVIEFMPGVLRSVQRGTITVAAASGSNTATVTAVNTARSIVLFCGLEYVGTAAAFNDGTGAGDIKNWSPYLTLTNATTVTVARPGTTASIVVSYELAEFF